jgi:diguanylate cyclase (GGDEF)-like protein
MASTLPAAVRASPRAPDAKQRRMSSTPNPPTAGLSRSTSWTDFQESSRNVEFIRQLEQASRAPTVHTHFTQPYEERFRRDVRLMFGKIRAWMTILSSGVLGTSPIWGGPVLNPPRDVAVMMRLFEYGLIIPICALAGWLQWTRSSKVSSERVFMIAFLVLAATLEWIRYKAAAMGFHMHPSLSSCVLVTFIVIGRVPLRESVAFIALYLMVILLFERFPLAGAEAAIRNPMDWVVEGVFIIIVLAGAFSNELFSRRNWAARQLLKALAYFDPLTKLPNRRAFEQHYEAVTRHARRDDKRLFVALADMDHFKNLNDRYGHEYGDGVLIEIGVVLTLFARRPLDMAARLGGEEFALVLYDCSRADGQRRIEELRRQIESLQIPNEDIAGGRVTVSVGGISVNADVPLAEAYRLADDVLYVAKREGRNRTVVANPPLPAPSGATALG